MTQFNPWTKRPDITSLPDDDGATPSGQADGYTSVVDGYVYFFSGGHRYKIAGTLDDPVTGTGQPIGLLLALTYP